MHRCLGKICAIAVLVLPGMALAQFDPARGGSPDRGGRFRFMTDPDQVFNFLSGGKDVISRADLTDPWRQRLFDRLAESMGIADGQITRDQYIAYAQQRSLERSGFGGQKPFGGKSASKPQPASGSEGTGPKPAPAKTEAEKLAEIDKDAEKSFQRHNKKGDGLLSFEEMPRSLQAEREKWDTNGDGFIDLNEYKAYYRARRLEREQQRNDNDRNKSPDASAGNASLNMIPVPSPPLEEDRKPLVYRAGKLPKELPAWFKELDTEGEGQVAFYQWKRSGRAVEDFLAMDRNNDGFLTVEEVLAFMTKNKDKAKQIAEGKGIAVKPVNGEIASKPDGGGEPSSAPRTFGRSRFGGKPPSSDSSSGNRQGGFRRGGGRGQR